MTKQILEGSRAIALTIKNIGPAVISAYPITPQTHIVEDLAKFKADGEARYEFIRAESEFAAASIIAGASATGVRVYSATCSQGLLLMAEVIYNIAGMRLPVVMTCANRAVSAPINIWNDQQDVMAVRDAGWILLFAENNQEAVNQHIIAYKIAEKTRLPVIINIDGFALTHTCEPVVIPNSKEIKKYLGEYNPPKGQYLDINNPVTLGAFATPAHYMEIREELHNDLMASLDVINKEYENYNKIFSYGKEAKLPIGSLASKNEMRDARCEMRDNGLIEYYGPKNPKVLLVALGSIAGTIKDVLDEINMPHPVSPLLIRRGERGEVGLLKIKVYRPFPAKAILDIIKKVKYVAVIDKSISLGHLGPLASDLMAVAQSPSMSFGVHESRPKIQSFIVGLGGRDVTREMIKEVIKIVQGKDERMKFVGKI